MHVSHLLFLYISWWRYWFIDQAARLHKDNYLSRSGVTGNLILSSCRSEIKSCCSLYVTGKFFRHLQKLTRLRLWRQRHGITETYLLDLTALRDSTLCIRSTTTRLIFLTIQSRSSQVLAGCLVVLNFVLKSNSQFARIHLNSTRWYDTFQ